MTATYLMTAADRRNGKRDEEDEEAMAEVWLRFPSSSCLRPLTAEGHVRWPGCDGGYEPLWIKISNP